MSSLNPVPSLTTRTQFVAGLFIAGLLVSALLAQDPGAAKLPNGPARMPDGSARTSSVHLRSPVAIALRSGQLCVANRKSGTISIVATDSEQVLAEYLVAKRISDMVLLPNGDVLVFDDATGSLLKCSIDEDGPVIDILASLPTGVSRIALSRNGQRVYLSAKWHRSVVCLSLDADFRSTESPVHVELPFSPHELLLVKDDNVLLAADAFGGRIAVIDATQRRLLKFRKLKGHNIRGMAVSESDQQLHVSHQQMTRYARADYEELHWGRLVTNAVEVFDLDSVLDGAESSLEGGWLDRQGGIGGATGDPGRVITGPPDLIAVALAGVGEVAVRYRGYAKRISVARHPQAMTVNAERLYVANRFDDSISVIDLPTGSLKNTISLGPAPELDAVERGERLFFDARLSHDGWLSCHSCHTDGHSSDLLVDTLEDGDYGAPKRVPSLLGTKNSGPWGWNGNVKSLKQQVHLSVSSTMHGRPISDAQTEDLVAYLSSLRTPKLPATGGDRSIAAGHLLFEANGCAECHRGPSFTVDGTFDVGLRDEHDRRMFNPPSLDGVSLRSRFFHDGRESSLLGVLQSGHQLDRPLSESELAELLSYLRSL